MFIRAVTRGGLRLTRGRERADARDSVERSTLGRAAGGAIQTVRARRAPNLVGAEGPTAGCVRGGGGVHTMTWTAAHSRLPLIYVIAPRRFVDTLFLLGGRQREGRGGAGRGPEVPQVAAGAAHAERGVCVLTRELVLIGTPAARVGSEPPRGHASAD